MRYYYETHTSLSPRFIEAEDDEQALNRLKEEFDERLQSVMIVYVEESKDNMRTVWGYK
jgi:hypothetical protein